MASDRIVTARHVLHAAMELERRGSDAVIKELEALEPDLVEYVLEQTCQIHHRLLRFGLSGQQARRIYRRAESITVVCVLALRQAHHDLWRDGGTSTPPRSDPPPSAL